MGTIKDTVDKIIDLNSEEVIGLVKDIDLHPELGFQEHRTSEIVAKYLKECSYDVKEELAITGLKTILKGKQYKYTIAFIAELDGVVCKDSPKASPKDGATHTCGHNLQLGILMLVAKALKESGVANELDGNIAFIAVPAEEYIQLEYRRQLQKEEKIKYLSGKQEFIRLGLFDDIDAAILLHAEPNSEVASIHLYNTGNGFKLKDVVCKGKTAHAAAAPHEGINALHALVQGINNINAIRDTFQDENHSRIHYIITNGGDNVNSVPSETSLQGYVRSSSIESIDNLSERFDKAFYCAGENFNAKMSVRTSAGYMPLICNQALNNVFEDNARKYLPKESIYHKGHFMASTDLGDLSHIMPVIQPMMGGIKGGLHSPDFEVTDYNAAIVIPAKIVTNTLIDLLSDNRMENILKGYKPELTKEEYLQLMEKDNL
ncbi:amidohydrolase [Dysgonomonas hofstadii]|uniref:Peptidase M20 domain-containing protein 2 n=1 Tax=Dysgonomonas hofstadii TaxID=637886 RepID=A0A840CT88_9BACT|nr:amidohydrolase [Dysgonomonas hofstadii]MBB4034943.1 amidohydrolase [Dysgonomonas hofstadii]